MSVGEEMPIAIRTVSPLQREGIQEWHELQILNEDPFYGKWEINMVVRP